MSSEIAQAHAFNKVSRIICSGDHHVNAKIEYSCYRQATSRLELDICAKIGYNSQFSFVLSRFVVYFERYVLIWVLQ